MNYNQQYETYELIIKDDEDEVFALSLVSEPAIQQDFIYFNTTGKKEVIKFATADEDKRTIVGPILIPNLKILRLKDDGTPYYVMFSNETVQTLAQNYIKDNFANNITLEHQVPVKNVSLVESWIVESSQYDKSKAYGLNSKPGTWMGVFKVDNEDIWNNYVKTGLVKGISLEGLFTHELVQASAVTDIFEKELTELSNLEANLVLNKIKNILKNDGRFRKGQRVDQYDMDSAQPSVSSTYAGEWGPKKNKKAKTDEKGNGPVIHKALLSDVKFKVHKAIINE
jgi:hypothetical protein